MPATHTPPGQGVPLSGVLRQALLSQRSCVQGTLSSQLLQLAPARPHRAMVLPGRHIPEPSTQPVQQLLARQTPPVQAVRSGTGLCLHTPASQTSVVQGLSSLGQTQALSPPTPTSTATPTSTGADGASSTGGPSRAGGPSVTPGPSLSPGASTPAGPSPPAAPSAL